MRALFVCVAREHACGDIRARGPARAIVSQQSFDGDGELGWSMRRTERPALALRDGAERARAARTAERPAPREQLEEHDAHGKQVAPQVELEARELLRRDEGALALDHAGRRPSLAIEGASDAEVGELDLAFGGHEHVVRRHVAMHDPTGHRSLSRRERSAQHRSHGGHHRRWKPVAAARELAGELSEIGAAYELEHQAGPIAVLDHVDQPDDVDVADACEEPCFLEHRAPLIGAERS